MRSEEAVFKYSVNFAKSQDKVAVNTQSRTTEIVTFAVLDLETSNLPAHNYNKTKITELCIYGISTKILEDKIQDDSSVPNPPRVLHKLNLLFNPLRMIEPEAIEKTGLDNFMLEYETVLNENAASTILGFLQHLEQPVCLVAHNGWNFDFPILKQALNKNKITLPTTTLCIDSLRAFHEIDNKRSSKNSLIPIPCNKLITPSNCQLNRNVLVKTDEWVNDPNWCASDTTQTQATNSPEINKFPEDESVIKINKITINKVQKCAIGIDSKQIDWRAVNETTPTRPTINRDEVGVKRRRLTEIEDNTNGTEKSSRRLVSLKSKRALFMDMSCAGERKYPPRNRYILGNMYSRIFQKSVTNAHQAEADVKMLTELIQHYGLDFLAFAETQAIPFESIKALGT